MPLAGDSSSHPNLENERNRGMWLGVQPDWEAIRSNQHEADAKVQILFAHGYDLQNFD